MRGICNGTTNFINFAQSIKLEGSPGFMGVCTGCEVLGAVVLLWFCFFRLQVSHGERLCVKLGQPAGDPESWHPKAGHTHGPECITCSWEIENACRPHADPLWPKPDCDPLTQSEYEVSI